jgi:F0F1-type ATP synthase assembly protein I
MPRAVDRDTQGLWSGFGDGFAWAVDLITATGVWAAVGFGLDRAFGTWPVLFAIGAVVGNGTGIYIIYRRSNEMAEREERNRQAEREARRSKLRGA